MRRQLLPIRHFAGSLMLVLVWALGATAQVHVAEMPLARSAPLVAHAERPRTYDVRHYLIDLCFDADRGRVSGSTTVRLAPLEDGFRELDLDAADLDVSSVRLEGGGALPFSVDAGAEALRITLDRAYAKSEPVGVVVTYAATPRRGLYFFKRAAPPDSAPAQFWSQGEANDNHHWFPCWDYPNDKATFEVVMTIDGGWLGISNGALVATRQNPDGTKTLVWRQTEPNATYLTMVAAGEFEEIRARWRGRPVSYLVPPARVDVARRVFRRTPSMMEFFSRRIGVDYPWPKYAQVAVTHFMFGGMENTSATTLADSTIRETVPPSAEPPELLLAHELAHQWFGDLITCRDWSHAWLNEGFATYLALVWLEHAEGGAAFRTQLDRTAEEFMASPAAFGRPLVHNVYRQPFDLFFDGVIYPKGALVLHMLRGVVGETAFWSGLRDYARRHAYGTVTTADFQSAMETASGRDLGWFFEEWTRHPGFPKLDVEWSWDPSTRTTTVRVRQLQLGEGVPVYRMPVAIRVGGRDEHVTIDARENVFTFASASAPPSVVFDPDGWLLGRVEVVNAER